MLYSGAAFLKGFGESKYSDSDSDDSDYDPLEEIEENESSMAGKVSKLKKTLCLSFEEPDTDIADFIKLSKIGNMTIIDIFVLLMILELVAIYTYYLESILE